MKTSVHSSSLDSKFLPITALASLHRTLACTALVVVLGSYAIYEVTLGLRVVSTESGRRLQIEQVPRTVPNAMLEWPAKALLVNALRADGRVAIVTFVYTRCSAICSVLGNELQVMQDTIRSEGLQDKVRLLTISFDERDTPEQLALYAERQRAAPSIWQFAGVPDRKERQALLDTFGIVVVPAPMGEFMHNAAFHIVDNRGRLSKILDYDNPAQALQDALAIYETTAK